MPLFLQNSFLAILMLIGRKSVQRRGIGEKCGFFATRLTDSLNSPHFTSLEGVQVTVKTRRQEPSSGLRTCWQKFSPFTLKYKTCSAKPQDQAGHYR